jgi:asparagine synthase (glutamine-hydrolysing)
MCGISGVYNFKNSRIVGEAEVIKMRDSLIHRGPDDAGVFISPDKKIGFGSRRLKIIDLSAAGHMPMTDWGKRAWITFNGEVYNFRELRKDLEGRGYKFNSHTDTEVVLNSYLEYGFDCVKKFNGMFAFAIWDEKKEIFFAARDHMGIKPFYYGLRNGTFYFGSEVKAILAHPDFKKELDEEGLSHFLTFSAVPAPKTAFKNIEKLPAANFLTIKNGIIEKRVYWNPVQEGLKLGESAGKNPEEFYVTEVNRILRDSIKSQMVSDVPFGCFLSGGVDSSTNAALMSQALGHSVETFSIGSRYEKYNEFQYSRKVAALIGAKSHETMTDENDLRSFLSKFAHYADDPNGDYICFPMFFLAEMTRRNGVIVVQIGEGSDEIFAGYSTYLRAFQLHKNVWRYAERLPGFLKNMIWRTAQLAPSPRFDFQKEYARRLAAEQRPFWGLAVAFSDEQKEGLLTPEFKSRVPLSLSYEMVNKHYEDVLANDPDADFMKQITFLEIKHRLPELLLARADKMTMAHSLEGRVPFLDRRLVELALSMPTAIKTKNSEPKYVLKKVIENVLPPEIINRPKQGFSTPMNEWLNMRSPISKELTDIIFKSKIWERGILDRQYVEKLISSNRYEDNAHIFRIWNLITISLWHDYWLA